MLGALTRHAELERGPFEGRERLLSLAAAHVGHVPIRFRGTLGGSVAHADPAAELPVALLALDAEIVVRSAAGERSLPVADFVLGPYTTALAPDEAVVAVRIPERARRGEAAFEELSVRAGDFALASVAVTALLENAGLSEVRIALGAVEAAPVRARSAEALLEGREPDDELIAEAAEAAAAECDPIEDGSTSVAYRRALVARLVRDALGRMRGGR